MGSIRSLVKSVLCSKCLKKVQLKPGPQTLHMHIVRERIHISNTSQDAQVISQWLSTIPKRERYCQTSGRTYRDQTILLPAEKPHRCDQCEKAFTQTQTHVVEDHINTVMEKRLVKGEEICGRKYWSNIQCCAVMRGFTLHCLHKSQHNQVLLPKHTGDRSHGIHVPSVMQNTDAKQT